jgi:hypothetical protein
MTLLNGWTAPGGGNPLPQYRKTSRNEVQIIGVINGAASTSATFAQLPAGYIPATHQPQTAIGMSGNAAAIDNAAYAQIDTSGNLTVAPYVLHIYVLGGCLPLDA